MRKLILFVLTVGTGLGCSVSPGTNPDPIEVTGTVTLNGKPVDGIVLNLQPTGTVDGQAVMPVRKGAFTGSAVPGKYTYFFTESSSRSAGLRLIPEPYRSGSLDRQMDIGPANATLTLSLD